MKKLINKIIETIKLKIRSKYIEKTAKMRRKKLINDKFTIISNNCWGGFAYQSYGIQYNTPTIGMFIVAEDYLKFIENLDYYLSIDKFKEIKPQKSKWYKELKNISKYGEYPIAKLGDIELHLLHYSSIKKAENDWNRRKNRIIKNKTLFKFSEMNLCEEKDIIKFQELKLQNKICFISSKFKHLKNDYTFIVSNNKYNQIKASEEPIGKSKIVNINNIINNLK